jgi:hypothetical protein
MICFISARHSSSTPSASISLGIIAPPAKRAYTAPLLSLHRIGETRLPAPAQLKRNAPPVRAVARRGRSDPQVNRF